MVMKQLLMIAFFAGITLASTAQPDKNPKHPIKCVKSKTTKTITNQKGSNISESLSTSNTANTKNAVDSTFKLADLLKQYNLSAPPADTTLVFK
jgi:hypothetical protein